MAGSMSVAWFPRGELEKALAVWPAMIDWEYGDYAEYCRHFEDRLRQMRASGITELAVSPIVVDDYLDWCAEERVDPSQPQHRARYAAVLLARGDATPWPPARRAPCWCGSTAAYGQCCGTRQAL